MRNAKCILSLIGLAVLSVGCLRADTFRVVGDVYGPPAGNSCSGETSCTAAIPNARSTVSVSEITSYNQIQVNGTINFFISDTNAYAADGGISGTIILPSTWGEFTLTVQSSGNETLWPQITVLRGSQSDFLISHGTASYVLAPNQVNQIQFEDRSTNIPYENGGEQDFSITASDPNAPAPTPEPASAALVALPLLAAGLARWKSGKRTANLG